jgi:hypothetical protein
MEKARQYPKRYTSSYIAKSMKAVGKIAGDCICLIKAYIWMNDAGAIVYPADKITQTKTDLDVDAAFTQATIKGPIKTIPEIPGICVRYPGHVGVYIGNGEVIEARGVDYGVVKTKLTNRGLLAKQWTDWFFYPGISYEEAEIMLKKGDKGVAVYDFQTVVKALGYDTGKWLDMFDQKTPNGLDGSFGDWMEKLVKELQVKYKLPVTGIVDAVLYGKLAIALINAAPKAEKEIQQLEAQIKDLQIRLTNSMVEKIGMTKEIDTLKSKIQSAEKALDEKRAEVLAIKDAWRKFNTLVG